MNDQRFERMQAFFRKTESELAEILRKLDPEKDYHVAYRREGTMLVMTIEERAGGNLPGLRRDQAARPEVSVEDDLKEVLEYTLRNELEDYAEYLAETAESDEEMVTIERFLCAVPLSDWDGLLAHAAERLKTDSHVYARASRVYAARFGKEKTP